MGLRIGGLGTIAASATVVLLVAVVPLQARPTVEIVGPSAVVEPPSSSSTTTTSTTTTSTSTTSTTAVAVPSPLPLAVTPLVADVAPGGTVTFGGRCSSGAGELVVSITTDDVTELVPTGRAEAVWTFVWTAPDDLADVASRSFRFWCGDPGDTAYPDELVATVDIVALVAPPIPPAPVTTTTTSVLSAPPVGVTLPATG